MTRPHGLPVLHMLAHLDEEHSCLPQCLEIGVFDVAYVRLVPEEPCKLQDTRTVKNQSSVELVSCHNDSLVNEDRT